MNRIEAIFQTHREQGSKAIMPFVTAGYPDLEASAAIIKALDQQGASICEIGIPFSDPIADGPTIQASMTHALNNNTQVEDVFAMIKGIREEVKLGLVAMVSFSIVYRFGLDNFLAKAKDVGFDGFIFPDLPLEEAGAVNEAVQAVGLTNSLLIAPTTPIDRAKEIASHCSGFVYVLARSGITGVREDLPEDLTDRLNELKSITDLPLCVGFGISKPEQVKAVTTEADAAIVGSALVKVIGENLDADAAKVGEAAGIFIADLATGLK